MKNSIRFGRALRSASALFAIAAIALCSACGKKKPEVVSSVVTSAQNTASAVAAEKKADLSSAPLPSESAPESLPSSSKISIASAVSQYAPPADLQGLDSTKRGWGPGIIRNHARPGSAVGYNEKYGKFGAVFVGEDSKNVYLTFDEGYENGYTAPILDTLRQKGVQAVFFVTADYVKRNPALVRRMLDEGHVVGNHSWSHPSMPTLSDEKAAEQITRLHEYVRQEFQYEMTLFRPPMGEFSPRSLAVTQRCGYRSIFWSFAYEYWKTDAQPEEEAALQRICDSTHNGAIFLLHAVSKTNSSILGSVIDKVREQGYTWAPFPGI